jgi:hypothetical protein
MANRRRVCTPLNLSTRHCASVASCLSAAQPHSGTSPNWDLTLARLSERSPIWEAASRSTTWGFLNNLWNSKVHCRVYRTHSLALSTASWIHSLPRYPVSKICFTTRFSYFENIREGLLDYLDVCLCLSLSFCLYFCAHLSVSLRVFTISFRLMRWPCCLSLHVPLFLLGCLWDHLALLVCSLIFVGMFMGSPSSSCMLPYFC